MTSRTIEAETGICEGCRRSSIVYDFMGDLLCTDCGSSAPEVVVSGTITIKLKNALYLMRKTSAKTDDGAYGDGYRQACDDVLELLTT